VSEMFRRSSLSDATLLLAALQGLQKRNQRGYVSSRQAETETMSSEAAFMR